VGVEVGCSAGSGGEEKANVGALEKDARWRVVGRPLSRARLCVSESRGAAEYVHSRGEFEGCFETCVTAKKMYARAAVTLKDTRRE
jgi:hypothetical protein